MPLIGTLNDFAPNTTIVSSDVDQNFTDIKTAFNSSAVLTDVAKTITVGHDWDAAQDFHAGSVSAPGIYLNGDTDTGIYQPAANQWAVAVGAALVMLLTSAGVAVTGTLSSTGAFTVDSGGVTVTAGGVAVAAGTTAVQALTATTGSFSSTLAVTGAATLSSTLAVTGVSTLTGDVIAGTIRRDTANGADNDSLTLLGGGAASSGRGASISLYGNEHATAPGAVQVVAGSVAGSYISWSADANTPTIERMRLLNTGALLIGDTANAKMTVGLTINQGGNDDEAFALKSSDVAHGMTAVAEADTYGTLGKFSTTEGTLFVRGFGEAVRGLVLNANASTADTTKSTSGAAGIVLRSSLASGSGVGAYSADGNLVAIQNHGTTVWIVDEDGDTWQSGGVTATTGDFSGNMTVGGDLDVTGSFAAGAFTADSLNLGGATLTDILSATTVWDPASIPSGDVTSTTVSVPGAAVGDFVRASNPFMNTSLLLDMDALVTSADTVTIVLRNHSTASINPASQTVRVVVLKF